MGEFEQWLKSLNENGRVTYFLGQEGKVAKEAWDFQQSKIEQLEKCHYKLMVKLNSINSIIHTAENHHDAETATAVCLLLDDMGKVLRGDSCG